jgi:hypothetical protein
MFYNNLNSFSGNSSGNMPPIYVNVTNPPINVTNPPINVTNPPINVNVTNPPINVNVNDSSTNNNNNPILKTINTEEDYYINLNQLSVCVNSNLKIDFMVIKANSIYLPIITSDSIGNTFKIINNTGNTLNIFTQNNQVIFSKLYTSQQGNTNVIMKNKSMDSFFAISSNDVFSWIMI